MRFMKPRPGRIIASRCTALLYGLMLGIFACAFPGQASAVQWTATQGDVLGIELSGIRASDDARIEVRAFGKPWPWKHVGQGRIKAWIGVDLAARPGEHAVQVKDAAGRQTHSLLVKKGHFRISRIEVKKKMAEFDAKTLRRIRADQAAIRQTYGTHVAANPDIAIAGEPVSGIVSTPFGAQRYVNGQPRSPHSGLDIAAPEGTPVINPLPGRVLLAESMYLNGNTVVIGHGNGLVMVYSHLHALKVKQGDWLKAGEHIGSVGMTGRATGPHLHWGVRFNQARVDPGTLLPHAAAAAPRSKK